MFESQTCIKRKNRIQSELNRQTKKPRAEILLEQVFLTPTPFHASILTSCFSRNCRQIVLDEFLQTHRRITLNNRMQQTIQQPQTLTITIKRMQQIVDEKVQLALAVRLALSVRLLFLEDSFRENIFISFRFLSERPVSAVLQT